MKEILRLFPEYMFQALQTQINSRWDQLEEIRLRLHTAIELNFHSHMEWVENSDFSREDSVYVLNQLSQHSLYRLEDELREGYITIKGGHRVGLAGEVITENGVLKQLHYITFFNIRIAKQIQNIATPFLSNLKSGNTFLNTLIIGAPQAGKTTMLRDLARLIGNGHNGETAKKVGIVDERSEIAASLKGVPQHEVGKRTDILDACPKVEGLMMMIRSMSPEVLIIDEIGKKQDVQALMEAIHAGVTIICTIHGFTLDDIKNRPSLQVLFTQHVFQRFIMLQRANQDYFTITLLDSNGEQLQQKKMKKQ